MPLLSSVYGLSVDSLLRVCRSLRSRSQTGGWIVLLEHVLDGGLVVGDGQTALNEPQRDREEMRRRC